MKKIALNRGYEKYLNVSNYLIILPNPSPGPQGVMDGFIRALFGIY